MTPAQRVPVRQALRVSWHTPCRPTPGVRRPWSARTESERILTRWLTSESEHHSSHRARVIAPRAWKKETRLMINPNRTIVAANLFALAGAGLFALTAAFMAPPAAHAAVFPDGTAGISNFTGQGDFGEGWIGNSNGDGGPSDVPRPSAALHIGDGSNLDKMSSLPPYNYAGG